ncbi:MAG: hypothetical protein K2I34_06655 [Paramuribaculum sp.]|nr:hypothetical protein [Paramuribaculum sp.]
MKKTIITLLLCILLSHPAVNGQDNGLISYFPVVVGADIPEKAKQSLTTKMEQALTQNGFGSTSRTDRLVMLAKCNVLEKDVAPTTPPRIAQTVEVTFIIGDVVENKTYTSTAFELKGIGTNETKAWQTAFNALKSGNPQFKAMFEEAYRKIDAYYSDNCKKLIAEAQTMASTGNYDRAIASLMSIPDICSDCHQQALAEVTKIYGQKIDAEGAALLSKAKSVWAAKPDSEGGCEALAYLSSITMGSSSFDDAEALVAHIAEKLSSDKEREWQQRLKEYNDDKEFRRREQSNSHARSMATIAACRSVAEKWAENQPQTNVYLNW